MFQFPSVDETVGLLPGLESMKEEAGQPVRAGVVTAHHTVNAGPHMAVSYLHQPQGPLGLSAEQSGGDVVETPGSGEVEAVKVDQLAVSLVLHLPHCQRELGIKELGQKLPQPGSEVLVSLDDLHHQVSLLQAGGEEIKATGLVANGTAPALIMSLLNISLVTFYLSVR